MNADMQYNSNNKMTLMKATQIGTVVALTLLMLTQTAGAEGITAVRTEKGRAVIEAELDPSTGLSVFVGQGSPHWTTWVNKVTNLTATVEASSQIGLQDGSFEKGFIFRCYATIQYVAITQDGPVPFGELTFRDNEKVSRSGGIFTFADIRKSDGTLVPVSVRAWKGPPPVHPALAQPEQSGVQGGSNILLTAQPSPDAPPTGVVTNLVPLKLGSSIPLAVQSPGVAWKGNTFHLVRLGSIAFDLDKNDSLKADIQAGVTGFDDVDYDISGAVFDAGGQMLGTARTQCKVKRMWVGNVKMTAQTIRLDFGVSLDYTRAAAFAVSISNRRVLTPDEWQK